MDATSSERVPGIGAGSILRRQADGTFSHSTDEVAVEEPLEIRIGQDPVAITMRTPGADIELAAGFLLSEAIIRQPSDLKEIAPCLLPASHGNVLNVTLSAGVRWNPAGTQRFGTISTSCGLCGKSSIEHIRQQFDPLPSGAGRTLEVRLLLKTPEQLRAVQGNFSRTGGIHAAAIFDFNGSLLIAHEDIGRHNAVDKVIGRAFLDKRLPLTDHLLLVSGRASLEIVQKALAGGISTVVSVSAPSTLAINFARESGQTLIGFLRPPTFNVYAHIERLNYAAEPGAPVP